MTYNDIVNKEKEIRIKWKNDSKLTSKLFKDAKVKIIDGYHDSYLNIEYRFVNFYYSEVKYFGICGCASPTLQNYATIIDDTTGKRKSISFYMLNFLDENIQKISEKY